MKKKYILIIAITLTLLGTIIYSIFTTLAIRGYISKDMKTEFPDKFIDYQIIRCDFGVNNIEYAFVGEYKDRIDNLKIFFYGMNRDSIFTINNWTDNYIGGTTIKNTTFPQLVAMVKEDCSQFQGGFVNKDPDGIRWTHTRADTKEEKAESIRRVSYGKLKLFPEFIEVYGDIDEMTDDEVIALHEQIKEEGLDAKVQMADDVNDLRKELLEITQEQRDQVRQAYGEWKDFTNEEFLEWIEIIKVDMESGKFVLIGK